MECAVSVIQNVKIQQTGHIATATTRPVKQDQGDTFAMARQDVFDDCLQLCGRGRVQLGSDQRLQLVARPTSARAQGHTKVTAPGVEIRMPCGPGSNTSPSSTKGWSDWMRS